MTLTPETFLRDVESHAMTILQDDGVRRHLRFRRPDTGCMGFDVLTWPGRLCYTGDMGTYVFARVEDMFQFFRCGAGCDQYRIDMRYWAEKVEAADKTDGITEFSPDKFREAVKEIFDEYAEDLSPSYKAELWSDVEYSVLSSADDLGYPTCLHDALAFEDEGNSPFEGIDECNVMEFTHRFRWCCYALRWAIAMYDRTKEGGRGMSGLTEERATMPHFAADYDALASVVHDLRGRLGVLEERVRMLEAGRPKPTWGKRCNLKPVPSEHAEFKALLAILQERDDAKHATELAESALAGERQEIEHLRTEIARLVRVGKSCANERQGSCRGFKTAKAAERGEG